MSGQFNLLTVDLEEWFVVEALTGRYPESEWNNLPSTVADNAHRLLELFNRRKAKATWFSLGWVANKYPNLMAEIAAGGHEIACHSYSHRRVDTLTRDEFRKDTEKCIDAIFRAVGYRPLGYRAPSWSMNDSVPWAFETLAQLDFLYDSSIFPIKHDLYGMPDGPRHLFKMKFDSGGTLYELPASTYRFFGRNIPMVGGGYLRHAPYWYSRMMVRRLNRKGHPAVVYIHPWEIDPNPPAVSELTPVQQLRMYGSTSIVLRKLDQLLKEFRFCTVSDYIQRTSKRSIGFERN